MRWPARIALLALAVPLGAELLLQGAALRVDDRSERASTGAATIVCVGDSHTYGAAVKPEESYPSQLQARLDEAVPHHYNVINLGVPGHNTTQVLNRLPAQALRHDAAMILVWVGINDIWNRTEVAEAGSDWRLRWDALASHSRLYRLLRVRAHDREIARTLDAAGIGERAVITPLGGNRWQIQIGGSVEEYQNVRVDHTVDEAMVERATRNYRAMAHWAKAAGIPIAFLTYPVPLSGFAAANRAIEAAASETKTVSIGTTAAIGRVPADQRQLLWAAHPNPPMYREIARDVAEIVLASIPPTATR